ncbi:AMP phosphorylase [Candidatus Tiddalikarchaeum anstoanum]|nr:AMP phosphorylase [Candidatus Tiddalikarchaeum anstoanum]
MFFLEFSKNGQIFKWPINFSYLPMNNVLLAKPFHIETGAINIAVLNAEQAKDMDIKHLDRVLIKSGKKSVICSVDITNISVKKGEVGLFVEPWNKLGLKASENVTLETVPKPASMDFIRAKLDGAELSKEDIYTIVNDIVNDALTDVELTAFITSSYCKGLSMEEAYWLTRAMVDTGEVLDVGKGPIFDKHSIGGVPGNRVTILLVPIVTSTGLKMPKTSSRAITSPAGTADTVEVFCPVTLTKKKMEEMVRTIGGCMAWGGSFNLAPADDKIIKVEKPLSIDAEGQMLSSIMAKKISVGATHVLVDLPMGPGTKIPTHERAEELSEKFTRLGEKLGLKVYCIVDNGSQPCGNGVGPALEARDVLKILQNDPTGPADLLDKALLFAGTILELGGKAKKGKGQDLALEIIKNGKAYEQFKRIVKAQGGNPNISLCDIKVGPEMFDVKSEVEGMITMINNNLISKCARAAGAPHNQGAGVYVIGKLSMNIKKGTTLMTIYAESAEKLERAKEAIKGKEPFVIQ